MGIVNILYFGEVRLAFTRIMNIHSLRTWCITAMAFMCQVVSVHCHLHGVSDCLVREYSIFIIVDVQARQAGWQARACAKDTSRLQPGLCLPPSLALSLIDRQWNCCRGVSQSRPINHCRPSLFLLSRCLRVPFFSSFLLLFQSPIALSTLCPFPSSIRCSRAYTLQRICHSPPFWFIRVFSVALLAVNFTKYRYVFVLLFCTFDD